MQICNYCGRNLKRDYDTCPGCGSTSFKKTNDFGEKVIKTPPKGGYVINIDNFENAKKTGIFIFWFGFIFLFISAPMLPFPLMSIFVRDKDYLYGLTFSLMLIVVTIPFLIFSISFMIWGKNMQKKAKKSIKKLKKLAQEGILVKNIPFTIVPNGETGNNLQSYYIQVKYENELGQVIPLKSEAKYEQKTLDNISTADLLIDPNDNSNYFIDLEIY